MEKESRSSLRCPCLIPEDVDEENINAKVEDGESSRQDHQTDWDQISRKTKEMKKRPVGRFFC